MCEVSCNIFVPFASAYELIIIIIIRIDINKYYGRGHIVLVMVIAHGQLVVI